MTTKTDRSSSATTYYTYDAENRLTAISTLNSNISYAYDPFGRRIQKNVDGTITRYIYDREDILLELDGNNIPQANFIHGPGIDEPLIMERGGQVYYYHYDGLGSVMDLTDGSGNIVQTYYYDSFGNIVEQTGSIENPYTYTGREYDSESGLYYYRARYYDARVGRFITEDPIGLAGGDINFYRYSANNSVNLIDPTGLWGFGGVFSETTDLGFGGGGAGQTGSFGGGLFGKGLSNFSLGGFASWGGFAGNNHSRSAYPSTDCDKNFSIGAFAGGGFNLFFTNANSAKELAGPSLSRNFNFGIGAKVLSIQYTENKKGVFTLSVGLPVPITPGGGFGVSYSEYNINTW